MDGGPDSSVLESANGKPVEPSFELRVPPSPALPEVWPSQAATPTEIASEAQTSPRAPERIGCSVTWIPAFAQRVYLAATGLCSREPPPLIIRQIASAPAPRRE